MNAWQPLQARLRASPVGLPEQFPLAVNPRSH